MAAEFAKVLPVGARTMPPVPKLGSSVPACAVAYEDANSRMAMFNGNSRRIGLGRIPPSVIFLLAWRLQLAEGYVGQGKHMSRSCKEIVNSGADAESQLQSHPAFDTREG